MKEEVTSQGFVLKVMPYKENDAILTIYFREYGKLSVIASGIRKTKSKNASACQPLMLSEFTLFLRQGLCKMIRAVPIESFRYLQEDINSQASATLLAEYFYRAVGENEPNLSYYQFMKETFQHLNHGYPSNLVYLFIIAFILKDCGSSMMVDHCVHCDNTKQIVSLSVKDGGFVCLNHFAKELPLYSVELLRLVRYVNRLDIKDMDQINASDEIIIEAKAVMEMFLDEYCPVRLASRKFI